MKLFKTNHDVLLEENGMYFSISNLSWDELINHENLPDYLRNLMQSSKPIGDESLLDTKRITVPIGTQEVWAAGVTYLRSKVARMAESEQSGGASFYDKVYEAERPELFFKANAHRVIPDGAAVRIRKDSSWDVPEPELTLVINALGKIVGYTIGNDMSSRSIEGENPLYLPQAKMYDGSAAIGPCILVKEDMSIDPSTIIVIEIKRNNNVVYHASTTIDQMKRSHEELVEFLYREYSFPKGAYLMTGTCLVPDEGFTLSAGDVISISISGIGRLINHVE